MQQDEQSRDREGAVFAVESEPLPSGGGSEEACHARSGKPVELRRFPHPYRAMLAVCSDLDETPDRHVYREIMRYLNTSDATSMGSGVGLEVGNTIYFDMPGDQFAYWTTDDAGRDMVRALIKSGHIDCLHSYGDFATTRAHAGRALDELNRYDCRLAVWIDHAVAPSNFGADIMCGSGDVPGSAVYHADLTCDFGVKYVWRGRVSSVIGQGRPRSLKGVFRAAHPIGSLRSMGKEWAKGRLARKGDTKYAMHGPNDVVRRSELRDGRGVVEFLRSNPFWRGPGHGATAGGVANILTEAMLNRLVAREGYCVFYTHLGKIESYEEPFAPATRRAFEGLAGFARRGDILVTTTRRLIGYALAKDQVRVSARAASGGCVVDVEIPDGPDACPVAQSDLAGLTVYVDDPDSTRMVVNGSPVGDLRRNGPDHTGRTSVSIPWHRPLEFPDV